MSTFPQTSPHAGDWFDAGIAETGAVLRPPPAPRPFAEPISPNLTAGLAALASKSTACEVIVACDARHGQHALDEIRRAGADYQLVRNRLAL